MNTESYVQKIMPILDEYMLVNLKINQILKNKPEVDISELRKISDGLKDELTEIWASNHEDLLQLPNKH